MAIPFPNIDPVALSIPVPFTDIVLPIRWYGLAYLAGLALGWLYMRKLLATARLWPGAAPMRPEQVDDFLLWATLGTVIGGRLGFILFYEPSMFIADPWRVFAITEGGMAFHGGLLGVGLAIYLFARVNHIPVLSLMDLTAAAVPFGLFFGRIANFINGEIYGRLSSAPWAVDFPVSMLLPEDKPFPGPRHPTQLYEAAMEGVLMFILLRWLTHGRGALRRPGLTTGAFLIAYGVFRSIAEYFKEWDEGQFFTTAYFSEGMVYSLPMIALGLYFWLRSRPRQAQTASA
ncbi:MAG: prolipoprotein diacylglyceryl transferase [Hyphomicrobiales bacterium]|nr:prolipoprotein diacylglyceryl transferase [Hyphomicrobiales bacterium]